MNLFGWYVNMWRDALWHPAISHRYLSRFCIVIVNTAAGLGLGFLLLMCASIARMVSR